MPNLCARIKNGLNCLPPKDAELCRKYYDKRDFESILEIAKSALVMKRRDDIKEVHKEKWEKIDMGDLEQLVGDTQEYLDFLDISESLDEEDYYG